MIFGVTLFLRLLQALVRPHKVRYACPVCGLQRHEADAVHCKACGTLLNIPDEGTRKQICQGPSNILYLVSRLEPPRRL